MQSVKSVPAVKASTMFLEGEDAAVMNEDPKPEDPDYDDVIFQPFILTSLSKPRVFATLLL